MEKIEVERPRDNSKLIEQIISEIKKSPEGASYEIVFNPPIFERRKSKPTKDPHHRDIKKIEKYEEELSKGVIEPANEFAESYGLEKNFESKIEMLTENALLMGPLDKSVSIGLYIFPGLSAIKYNDGGDFFKDYSVKSRWEAGAFNPVGAKDRLSRSYELMGQNIKEKWPESSMAINIMKGSLYLINDE